MTNKTATQQTIQQTQALIDRLHSAYLNVQEVRDLSLHTSPLVRANAFDALARLAPEHPEVIGDLVRAAQDPNNACRVVGVRLSYVAVAALLRISLREAAEAAEKTLLAWPEPDRDDLLWYLKAERLYPTAEMRNGRGRQHRADC